MASTPGGSADDGNLSPHSNPTDQEQDVPTLEPIPPQDSTDQTRRLTRASARQENIRIPDWQDPDVTVRRINRGRKQTTNPNVAGPSTTRPGEGGKDLHQPLHRGPEGTTPTQEGSRDPSGASSQPISHPSRLTQGDSRCTSVEPAPHDVQRGLDQTRTRSCEREQPTVRPAQEPTRSRLADRSTALETPTNSSLPTIQALLENIQNRLDGLEAGAARSSQGTQRREPPRLAYPPQTGNIHEEFTDEEEQQNAHARHNNCNHGTARNSRRLTGASYYSRTRSRSNGNAYNHYNGYHSDSSSEDDYYDRDYITGHEDSSPVVSIVPFHSRPVGPPHIGLRSIKPANRKLDKLMSYRSYRLRNTTDMRTSRDTAEVRIHIKNLNLTLKNHTFDGNDPIKIFDFLSRFVNEADMLNMSEAQAFIALPIFLADPAETQFRTNLSGASRHGGVTCWTEAIQYLLRTYATASAMRKFLEDLRNIRQGEDEVEEAYRKRLNECVFRCGNVHSEDEKMTLYVDGLSDTIRMIVARYRESVHRRDLTFESLCHFAKSEDEAYRARLKRPTPTTTNDRQSRRTPSTPNVWSNRLRRAQASDVNLLGQDTQGGGDDAGEVMAIPDQDQGSQDANGDEGQPIDQDELFYVPGGTTSNRRSPPRIPFESSRTPRVGWADSNNGQKLICHSCYAPGHISPQCQLKLYQLEQVL